MRKVYLLMLPGFLLFSSAAFTQLLQGRVRGESGGLARDVSVQFQNKLNAITTDEEGRFRIMATKLPDTLVFSAVGYEPYKVVITEKNIKDVDFEVVLLNSRAAMDEVVVTAMSSHMKKEVTGSAVYSWSSPGKKSALYDKSGATSSGKPSYDGTIAYYSDRYFFKDTNTLPRLGVLAKSRIVTAGEVNDFNKWKMWEDYNEKEFKVSSRFWSLYSKHRFSVQVTDKKHNAVINEHVYLVDKKTIDTVWTAYSDNTGKAELWASFFDTTGVSTYYISTGSGSMKNDPVEFSNGINHISVDRTCQVSNEVEIAFVVDATGSMGDEIEFLKLELEDVIQATMAKYNSLTLKMASVFYRDKDDIYVTKHVPFHDDPLKTLNFIKLQEAGGGGDYPEAMDEALAVALDSLNWSSSSRARILFLLLDAPPHSSARERVEKLIAKAAAMGIRIVPVACSGTDKSTEFLLRSIALATNGTYAFLTDHSGVGNKHIEPTTDKYSVELLNSLLQRVIGQYVYAKDCNSNQTTVLPDTGQPDNVNEVKIYPNPTSGRFTIESMKEIKEIYVADFSGKILMRLSDQTGKTKKQRWQVDITPYASGTYLVKYITSDNKWGSSKVILIH